MNSLTFTVACLTGMASALKLPYVEREFAEFAQLELREEHEKESHTPVVLA